MESILRKTAYNIAFVPLGLWNIANQLLES